MAAIEAPPPEWGTPLEAFEHTLGHEQKVTGLIHDLMELAMSEMDHATANMLQWFVSEQVEEEANATEIVFKMKLASAEKGAVLLYLLDQEARETRQEARKREATPPAHPRFLLSRLATMPAGWTWYLMLHGSHHPPPDRCRPCAGLLCRGSRHMYQRQAEDQECHAGRTCLRLVPGGNAAPGMAGRARGLRISSPALTTGSPSPSLQSQACG